MMWMRNVRWRGVGILAAAAALLLSSGCKRPQQAQGMGMQRPPAPVTVAEALSRDVPLYLDEIGKCSPYELVNLQAQVTGRVKEIHFKDGAEVQCGDVLYTLDPRPFQAEVQQATAALAQRTAELRLAELEWERVKGLLEKNAVSKQDYDARQNAVAVSKAQVEAAQATVETAKVNLDYCTIASPIDGRVGQRMIDVGNVVNMMNPNGATLVVIQRVDPIYADFTIAEGNLPSVRQRMAAGTLKAQVMIPGQAEKPREGDVTFIDTAVQQGAGTVKLRATLKNKDRHFWPGQFVEVRLVPDTIKSAVLVPSQAVQISQGGPFVYVVKADGTAELRPVVTGQRQQAQEPVMTQPSEAAGLPTELVVIQKGVTVGERVVVTGQMLVAPGGKVNVMPPMGPPAGGPGGAAANAQ